MKNFKGVRAKGSSLAEFAPTLFVLMLVIFPAIDLTGMACGYCVVQLVARQGATGASTQPTYAAALTSMSSEANRFLTSGFGKFAKLQPVGGYANTGADLNINVTNVYNNNVRVCGPNIGLSPPVDTTANIYEASVTASYDVGPLISLASVPFFKDIPALGKPWRTSATFSRAIEQPEKYTDVAIARETSTTPTLAASSGGRDLGTWDYWDDVPGHSEFTVLPGQGVLESKQLTVMAANTQWTDTQIDVLEGDRLSFDFAAEGNWSTAPWWSPFNADGVASHTGGYGLPEGILIGRMGATGQIFAIGKDLVHFNPPGTGRLFLAMNEGVDREAMNNDNYNDNSGEQQVKVYRTD